MVADSVSPQNSPSARLSGSQYPRTGLSCGGRETARQQQSTVARDWQGGARGRQGWQGAGGQIVSRARRAPPSRGP